MPVLKKWYLSGKEGKLNDKGKTSDNNQPAF